MQEVIIVKTGCANLASIIAALTRVGATPIASEDPRQIAQAKYLVLPGVGTFGAAMTFWQNKSLCDPIREYVQQDKPLLAICLGLQLLCESSEETPGVEGLAVVQKPIARFASHMRVPQMGWNYVCAQKDHRFLESGYYYFANSYYLEAPPTGSVPAMTYYGNDFVSAFESGNSLACQFHPELSGKLGLKVLENWLRRTSC